MISEFKYYLLWFMLILGVSAGTVVGQSSTTDLTADSCEAVSSKLDAVGKEYSSGDSGDFLVIIGSFPRSMLPRVSDALFADSIRYLAKFHKVDERKIAYGVNHVGGRRGEIQFFVRGKLTSVISTTQKSKLCFGIGETFRK